MALWFTMLCLVIGCILAYKLVRLITDRLYPVEKDTNVKNAAVIDSIVGGTQLDTIESYSAKFELVRQNPLDYEKHEREEVTHTYCDLLKGRIKDPEGKHAPCERQGIHLNPDYIRYLRNQVRVLGPNTWHKEELDRVRQVEREEEIGIDIRDALVNEHGCHIALAHSMTTDARMESYGRKEWIDLVRATNRYIKNGFKLSYIQQYLEEVEDQDVLLDENKMEMFGLLLDKDVPARVAGICVSGILEDEDLGQVLALLNQRCTIDEALSLILTEKKREIETEAARREMSTKLL